MPSTTFPNSTSATTLSECSSPSPKSPSTPRGRSGTIKSNQSVDFDLECKLWSGLSVDDWSNSIRGDQSIFVDLYEATLAKIQTAIEKYQLDGVIDFGCGSGEILGELSLRSNIPCVGMDINPEFIDHCKQNYPKADFIETSVLDVETVFAARGYDKKFKRPLIMCCNNTLPILPEEIRSKVVSLMLKVAGADGKVLITFWDGRFFPHAVLSYYKKNPQLCGEFEIEDSVDFEARHLETPSGYCSTWLLAKEVLRMMESFDINCIDYCPKSDPDVRPGNYVEHVEIGIFVWASGKRNTAKDYYDSEDAQQFYTAVWGESTIHIGNYELLEEMIGSAPATVPASSRILLAQKMHENKLIERIKSLMVGASPFRIADLGCGYGGFLRDLTETGCVWQGYGYDISDEMISRCKHLNDTSSSRFKDRITWGVESYLSTSLGKESVDVAFSMDAFLHVGEKLHCEVLKEAWRILRPGGFLVFTDIMQRPEATPEQMSGILKRIHLPALGSLDNYKACAQAQGFSNFSFDDMSPCLPMHYATVKQVLHEKRVDGTLASLSEDFVKDMLHGLNLWESSGAFLQWGIIVMQKTGNPMSE